MTSLPLPPELASSAAFSRGYARAGGLTDDQLRGRRLTKVCHGWYAVELDSADLSARCEAFRGVLPGDAVFSDHTAAQLYGLPLPPAHAAADAPIHVTLRPQPAVPRRREVVVHQRALPASQVRTIRGLPVTAPERTYADLAVILSREQLTVLGDVLLGSELTTVGDLQAHMMLCRGRRGVRLGAAVLPLLDGRAQSPPESVVRLRLADAGIPAEPQCPVTDPDGRILGHADLGYREHRVAIEYEGRQHSEGQQFDYDIERYSRFAAAGWLVIRCGRRDLADGSAALIARVRAALSVR